MDSNQVIHEKNRAQHLIRFLKKLPVSNYINNSLEKIIEEFFQEEKNKSKKSSKENNQINSRGISNFQKVLLVELKKIHTSNGYALIPLSSENRKYFPGYKIEFILETDIGRKTVHVTSGNKGDILGDKEVGKYIVGKLQDWYENHKKLKDGSILKIEIIERNKTYKLSVESY